MSSIKSYFGEYFLTNAFPLPTLSARRREQLLSRKAKQAREGCELAKGKFARLAAGALS